MGKNAIVLCSGGLDSVVTSYYVRKKYNKIIILFFNYNQRSLIEERKSSKKCAKELGAEFREIELKWLGDISGSLINKKGKIGKMQRADLKDTKKESEKFYVPCRNTIFLTYALALAESLMIKEKEKYNVFVGFKCEGSESYPDTTPKFVSEMNKLSKISTKGFKIIAPLIEMDKEDIVLLGRKLGVDLGNTFSCYAPKNGKQCGFCLACMLRKQGFYWAGIEDGTEYWQQSKILSAIG